MSRQATTIELTEAERAALESWVRSATTEQRYVLRARIVLGAASGASNQLLAADLRGREATVCRWRCRFAAKASDIVGLYLSPPEGAVVLCMDEKPSIQALQRAQGWLRLPDGKALTGAAHEYRRNGTTTLFAALQLDTGQVLAGHYQRRRRREFLDFMNTVVAQYGPDTPTCTFTTRRHMPHGSTRSRPGSANCRARRCAGAASSRSSNCAKPSRPASPPTTNMPSHANGPKQTSDQSHSSKNTLNYAREH
jgi:hypothetical protein